MTDKEELKNDEKLVSRSGTKMDVTANVINNSSMTIQVDGEYLQPLGTKNIAVTGSLKKFTIHGYNGNEIFNISLYKNNISDNNIIESYKWDTSYQSQYTIGEILLDANFEEGIVYLVFNDPVPACLYLNESYSVPNLSN